MDNEQSTIINKPNNNYNLRYLFCPSEKCLNVPDITYNYNPINSEIVYKCKCKENHENSEQEVQKMNLKEFLEKSSSIFCFFCKKRINESKFIFCLDCKNIFDISCSFKHKDNENHLNYSTNNINDFCFEHKENCIFKCMFCNLPFCKNCDAIFHFNNAHSTQQTEQSTFNNKGFDNIKAIFEKQKTILEKIKEINNNFIDSLENDIQIKERIIKNYQNGKSKDNKSIKNLKQLYIKNQENYENFITKYFNEIKKESNDKEKFVNEIILPFIYSLMINKDESFNDELIDIMKSKLNSLDYKNKLNKYNEFSSQKNEINNNIEHISKNNQERNCKININYIKNDNNKENLNVQIKDIYTLKQPLRLPIFSDTNNLNDTFKNNNNNLNINNNEQSYIQKNNFKENKINKQENSPEINSENIEKKKKGRPKKLIKKANLKSEESSESSEEYKNFISNMILLDSGNFAISSESHVGIYDLRKIKDFNNKIIGRNNCLIQEIPLHQITNGKKISHIFQFPDKTLLCAIYSEIIIIKLKNQDMDYEIIGKIKLKEKELTRKLISLGDSLLVILSEQEKNCYIKIYEKIENKLSIQNIFANMNNILNTQKFNYFPKDYKYENNRIIKEDLSFKNVIYNLNNSNVLWTTLFALKTKNDNLKYHEFIATSNAEYLLGKNSVIFFGIKKEISEHQFSIQKVGKIKGISCSVETNSICQIDEQYICIGLENFNKLGQTKGFAIIDIYKREFIKRIENDNINSIYYDKQNNFLISSMEAVEKKIKDNFIIKIYKVIKNEENGEIKFINISEYKSKHTSPITSIHKIQINSNNDYIFVTLSSESELEVINTEF